MGIQTMPELSDVIHDAVGQLVAGTSTFATKFMNAMEGVTHQTMIAASSPTSTPTIASGARGKA